MKKRKPLRIELRATMRNADEPLKVFALLNLGLVQSLASGVIAPEEATAIFYHGDNCLFVRREVRNRTADAIMSHGAQLADLFTVLSQAEGRRELYAALETIRSLCLKLLANRRPAGLGSRVAA